MKFSEIANIRTGITLRNSLSTDKAGDIPIIQPKDFVNGSLRTPTIYISAADLNNINKHQLKSGEILMVNKGTKFGSYLIEHEIPNAVASGSFFIIHCNQQLANPAFIMWYLQQPNVKEYLEKNSSKTTISSLGIQALNKMELNIPGLSTQKRIVEFVKLIDRQQALLKELIDKTGNYRDNYIWELILAESEK